MTDGRGSKRYIDTATITTDKESGMMRKNALATGYNATTYADDSVVLGAYAVAHRDKGVAVGSHAEVSGAQGSVALGTHSSADRSIKNITEAVSNKIIDFNGEVSVGNDFILRQITHIAGGIEDTDAVNIRQLRALDNKINSIQTAFNHEEANAKITLNTIHQHEAASNTASEFANNAKVVLDNTRQYEADFKTAVESTQHSSQLTHVSARQAQILVGQLESEVSHIGKMTKHTPDDGTIHIRHNLEGSTISVRGKAGNRIITDVADGVRDHDAATISQLNSMQRMTTVVHELAYKNALKMHELQHELSKTNKKVVRGLASSAALTGLFQPYNVGKIHVTVGFGRYDVATAIAIGTGYRFNTHAAVKAGFAYSGKNNFMYNAAFNLEW